MIDVALTPAALRPADLAVVIDVLRATSTATQALAAGYTSVLCADSVQRARMLRRPGDVLAGEERCVMPEDFDLDNSPLEATRCYGPRLILATTNGAPTIVAAARHAPTVVLAALLNLAAVQDALREAVMAGCEVQIVCSGTTGAPALEDVYVAGRLCAALPGPRSDAALMAQALAAIHPTAEDALSAGTHAAVLRDAGLTDDLAYCAQESTIDALGRVQATGPGTATVVDARDSAGSVCGVDSLVASVATPPGPPGR
jgi:2-phosphosulfolactate phosphatase